MRRLAGFAATLTLAACAAPQAGPPVIAPPPPQLYRSQSGLDRVLGQNADAVVRLFGAPELDVREGNSRRLQFGSAICVLDAYLYPERSGAMPRVTHIDARDRQGRDFDRASCIAALSRREEAQSIP